MEQNLHGPAVYDFRQHDQLWRRVNPGLEPYPAGSAAFAQQTDDPAASSVRSGGMSPGPGEPAARRGAESLLHGHGRRRSLLAVLEGYIEEELEDWRRYLALSRQAPVWARQALRDIAEEENDHARRLLAAGILLQGSATGPMWSGDSWTWGTGAGRCASATIRRPAAG